MKKTTLYMLSLLLVMTTQAMAQQQQKTVLKTKPLKTVYIDIENPSSIQRQELVCININKVYELLDLDKESGLCVRNAAGQRVDYQLTHDEQLIFETALRAQGKIRFTITKGAPRESKAYVAGRCYPERLDDMTWENDRCAYRLYGPALQKRGERSFGIDVWTKSTPELVVEKRYKKHSDGWRKADSLRKAGQKEEAREIDLDNSFHLDHGDGLDCYGVGPSLGCGAPALVDNGTLKMPYCFANYTILDNGPLRFTVELTYQPVTYKNDTKVVEHRRITLDKGDHFNQMTVWYEGLGKPCDMAAGVVVHQADTTSVVLGENFVQYADPTEHPNEQGSQIYVATLFPEGAKTQLLWQKPEGGIAGHAIGKVEGLGDKERYTYYFGAAWSSYDIQSQQQWQQCIDQFLLRLKKPLRITLSDK